MADPAAATSPPRPRGWRAFLDARIIRNSAIVVEKHGAGHFLVRVPLKRPRWHVAPISWVIPLGHQKKYELAGLSGEIFALIDDRSTVGELVDRVAESNQLTFHESRVSVTGYLQELVRRGIVVIAG